MHEPVAVVLTRDSRQYAQRRLSRDGARITDDALDLPLHTAIVLTLGGAGPGELDASLLSARRVWAGERKQQRNQQAISTTQKPPSIQSASAVQISPCAWRGAFASWLSRPSLNMS